MLQRDNSFINIIKKILNIFQLKFMTSLYALPKYLSTFQLTSSHKRVSKADFSQLFIHFGTSADTVV